MGYEFYCHPISPPSNTALMVVVALGVDHEVKTVDIFHGEQIQPEYLKINPQGTVPGLKDGDFCIGESRVIATYLCNIHEKESDSCLYPKDPKARAKVDQLLHASQKSYDNIIAYINVRGVAYKGDSGPDESLLEDVHKHLALCERYLNENEFVAGCHVTLADFFMSLPLHYLPISGFEDYGEYPKTVAWVKKVQQLPYFDKCNTAIAIITNNYNKTALANKQEKQ